MNMNKNAEHEITLEIGSKKVFASAIHWPGWCRSAQDEESAVQTLLVYAPRYARMLESTELKFVVPETLADFTIIERVKGGAGTDFGAPGARIQRDQDQPTLEEVQRNKTIFKAAWVAFDSAVQAARGKELRKGPRGGGRELAGIIDHVVGADQSYLSSLGWKVKAGSNMDLAQRLELIRSEMLRGIDAAAQGQLPAEGPRGGKRWALAFFFRYVIWHVVDHTWEIEDRIII
jgi:hypothetical protein